MRYGKFLGVLCLLCGAAGAQLPANLLVQGAVFQGGPSPSTWPSGTPFTVGIPIADADAIPGTIDSSPNNLKLCTSSDCSSGRQAAQFRVLAKWPSGNAKWVEVDGLTTQAVTSSTFDNSLYLVKSTGGGNYGGSLTVTDSNSSDPNSGTITVETGTATFVIRKANFDLFHKVTLGSSTVMVDDARTLGNDGLVLMGPPSSRDRTGVANNPAACNAAYPTAYVQPGELSTPSAHTFTAGQQANCSTAYLSNLDNASKAVVEEAGGLRAVIKVTGSLADTATACSDDGVTETAHCYTHYTARLTFYSGQSYAKVQVTHRNAAFATVANFNSSAKQFASLNAQVTMTLGSGNKTATVGNCEVAGIGGCATPPGPTVDAAFAGTDNLYVYQAYSNYLAWGDYNAEQNCSVYGERCLVSYIHRDGSKVYDQNGYLIIKNGSAIGPAGTSGSVNNVYPAGYADLKDSTGLGLETGVYQFSAYWPKSLQFQNMDSTHARALVGIWPDQGLYLTGGDQPYVQQWPTVSIHDTFFNFHASSLASPADSFHRLQENLIARVVPYTYYNHAQDARAGYGNLLALMYPLLDPIAYDTQMQTWTASSSSPYCSGHTAGNCLPDAAYPGPHYAGEWPNVSIFRHWIWTNGGSGNQSDWPTGMLRNWVNRGCTAAGDGKCTVASLSGAQPGRYVMMKFWGRYMAEQALPRSDFYGGWRGDGTNGTQPSCTAAELVPSPHSCLHLNAWGFPGAFSGIISPVVSWNGGVDNFGDNQNGNDHAWYHGLPDIYFLTGDESIKDQLLQGFKDTYLSKYVKSNNPAVGNYPNIGAGGATRALGHRLSGYAQNAIFLSSIGDAEADTTSLTLSNNLGQPLFGADNSVLSNVSPDLPLPNITALGTHPEQAGENEPAGCTANWYQQGCTSGVSKTRGSHFGTGMYNPLPYGGSCPGAQCRREFGMVMHYNMLIQGLWEYRLAALSLRGKNWLMSSTVNGYPQLTGDKPALDYLYLVDQGFVNDQYATVGSTLTATSPQGPTYETYPDFLNWTDLSAACGGGVAGGGGDGSPDPSCMACVSARGSSGTLLTGNSCSRRCDLTRAGSCQGSDEGFVLGGAGFITNSTKQLDPTYDWGLKLQNQVAGGRFDTAMPHSETAYDFFLNHNATSATNPVLAQVGSQVVFDDNGTTHQQVLNWTPPAGLCTTNCPATMSAYWMKYSSCVHSAGGSCTPKVIRDWLGFKSNCLVPGSLYPAHSAPDGSGQATATPDCGGDDAHNPCAGGVNAADGTGCFKYDPASNINFGAATDVPDGNGNSTEPTGSSYTFTTQANTTYRVALYAYQSQEGAPPVATPVVLRGGTLKGGKIQ